MPSPSENKAVDIVLSAFPGSEVITPDRTQRIPIPDPQPVDKVVDDGWGEPLPRPPKPSSNRRFKPGTKKAGKNQGGMFDG